MQFRSGGQWSVVFSCALMAAGAHATTRESATVALREVAVRIDAATRETVSAHAAARTPAAAASAAAKRAKGELDAIGRSAAASGFADDATFARKQHRVHDLLSNLERAQAAPRDAALPELVAKNDPARTLHAVRGTGASCAAALSIEPGRSIDADLAAGASLWLRIAPGDARFVTLDTRPTPLDTEIAVFGTSCPAGDGDAIARSDDAFGLSAALAFDAKSNPGVRYARVRNLGDAGRVVARVTTDGAFIGRITDARTGQPLSAEVQTVTQSGYFSNAAYSDPSNGLYLVSAPPGNYYVFANGYYQGSYVPELYPDAPCGGLYWSGLDSCDVAHATLLTLEDAQQIAGVDVALNIGGRIAGTVRDASTGAPLPNASISLYDTSGNPITYGAWTDGAGRYLVSGLLTGTVYAVASADGHSSQMWDHVDCGGPAEVDCVPLNGTPLAVVRDALTPGIDFSLATQAHIHATVTERGSAALPYSWQFAVYDDQGNYYYSQYGYNGQPLDSGALPPGNYRVYATSDGFFGQLWNGIDCPLDCLPMIDQGTPVTIGDGTVANVAFDLLRVPAVSGTITDATTHAPIPNLYVTLVPVDENDYYSFATSTDSAGHYTVGNALANTYYVFATSSDYRSTIYPDVSCPGNNVRACDTANATPVTTAYGGPDVPGIDFALPRNGSIAGHVTLRVPDGSGLSLGNPAYEYINVYSSDGDYLTSASAAADGSYVVGGLAAGTWRAIARGNAFDQAWGGTDCADACDPTQSAPIVLAQTQQLAGIDFDPYPRDWLFGRVTNASGAPLPGVAIDLWLTDGSHCGVGETTASGYYGVTNALASCYGMARLSTDAPAGYVNQVYDRILCPNGPAWLGLCSLDGGTLVPFPTTPAFSFADFVLGPPRDPIFASDFER